MDTIIIENLIYSGIHGVFAKEHNTPQRFLINLKLDVDTSAAGASDALTDTIDYSEIKQKIKTVIDGDHVNLIEHLGHKMLDSILEDTRIYESEVHIKKIDIWDNGTPSVTIRKKQSLLSSLALISIQEKIIAALETNDACVLPLLTPSTCMNLIDETNNLSFTKASNVSYGTHTIEQYFSYSYEYKEGGTASLVQHELENLLQNIQLRGESLFETPLKFNEIAGQRYEVCPVGITTHRDESIFKNMIIVCNIQGSATFYTSTARASGIENTFVVHPGDVIFMKAPGFLKKDIRPFHGVKNITSPRLSITFRQKAEKKL